MPGNPSLDYLRTLVAVHLHGSMTAAAEALSISQPAVSGQMRTLESQLGYPLFERIGRHLTLTPRAYTLVRQVAPYIESLREIPEESEFSSEEAPQVVHIGGPAEYLLECVVPRLGRLTANGVEFRLTFGLPDRLLADLASGLYDVVVSTVYPRVAGVVSVPLTDEEFVLVAAPKWAEKVDEDLPSILEYLEKIPVISYAADLPIVRRYWRTVFERGTERMHPLATIPDLRGVADAVSRGLGMSVLPLYVVKNRLASGELVLLHEPEIAPLNTVHLATRQGALHLHPWLRHVQDALIADARSAERDFYL